MDEFKGLNLKREIINTYIDDFAEKKSLTVRSCNYFDNNKKKRVIIGKPTIEDALVDLHLLNNGTTTIQYKIGKNQELGVQLAQHLYDTIDHDECISVNYSLKGITSEEIDPIFEELKESVDEENNNEFELNVEENDPTKKIIRIKSIVHQDSLVVTHYKTTKRLMIQGLALFCYRRIVYLISELLDLSGLQAVLSKTEENTARIVRKEVAEDYLKTHFVDSYNILPDTVKKLLVSGCCVKLASPRLPEYSMLLFPDLRALEGVLRTVLCDYHMFSEGEDKGFGAFFTVHGRVVRLNSYYKENVTCGEGMIQSLEKGYSFFRKHRNELFHMTDFDGSSRTIETLEIALALSKETYGIINDIFKSKK